MLKRHLAFALVPALLAGCVDDNVGLYISHAVLPTEEEGVCVFDPGTTPRSMGQFNVELGGSYTLGIVLNNQLFNRVGAITADPNGINIRRVEVELRDAGGTTLAFGDGLPNPFSIPASAFVPSSDGTTPGQAALQIEAIPNEYRQALFGAGIGGTIVVGVRAFGRTNGDIEMETADWAFPVGLCAGGCLFVCDPGADEIEGLCNLGQDGMTVLPVTDERCIE